MMPRSPSILPCAFLSLLLACACSAEVERPPNILIITLDTLRADHLSCYGYPSETTPRLDRLASAATRYTSCLATAPWTVPSHASLMTGLFPSEHGAITADVELGPGQLPWQVDNAQPLGPQYTTLAEVLRDEGFSTAGFVANTIYLRPEFGISQGFDSWVVADPWMRLEVSPAWSPWVTDNALRWLATHVAEHPERPFFLFLNYFDTHRPYNISPGSPHDSYAALDALHARVMLDGLDPGLEAEVAIEMFDRALATLDASLGQLLDGLEQQGLFEDTLIIITSDHGEYFGEHGLVEHSKDVYEEALHVPLIVKLPGQVEGQVDERRASLVDIPRLVLDSLPGVDGARHAKTFPYALGEHAVWAENHLSRPRDLFHETLGPRFRRRRFALYEDAFKFIYSSDGEHELYDLASDPREGKNLVADRPRRVARMTARAGEILKRSRAISAGARAIELSPEQIDMMEQSGYGGAAQDDEDDDE